MHLQGTSRPPKVLKPFVFTDPHTESVEEPDDFGPNWDELLDGRPREAEGDVDFEDSTDYVIEIIDEAQDRDLKVEIIQTENGNIVFRAIIAK